MTRWAAYIVSHIILLLNIIIKGFFRVFIYNQTCQNSSVLFYVQESAVLILASMEGDVQKMGTLFVSVHWDSKGHNASMVGFLPSFACYLLFCFLFFYD